MATETSTRRGGSWLTADPGSSAGTATGEDAIFTPERLTDEHRLMAQTTEAFVANEVLPRLDELEAKDWQLARALIRRCGELGLLGINEPEEYGGLDLD